MSDKSSAAWYLAPIFLGIILVMSASLAINHPSFGYGGGGGGGGGGGWSTMDPRVCGDKLCSEIPGGRAAFEAGKVPAEEEEEKSDPLPQEKSKIDYFPPPLKQIKDGIEPSHVTCNEGLELLLKQSNGKPARVKPTSVAKLIERGWVMPVLPDAENS